MANDPQNVNNELEKSRLQSAVLDYKKSKKLMQCGIAAIAVIAVLLIVFLTLGWGSSHANPGGAGGGTGVGTGDGAGGSSSPLGDGSFTVMIDKNDGNKSIAISETRGFANPTDTLKTNGISDAWNITLEDIPVSTIDNETGGAKNGHNYFAFTFFLKNTGTEALDYNELVTLTENNKDAVKAVRIMMFREGEAVTYAAPAKDGSKETFACDESFSGDVNLISKDHTGLGAGEVRRYTIVVWFEGNDPECVDDILGGTVELSLGLKIIG